MNTLREILKMKSATIVDVRSPMEFKHEHVEGASNIPLDEVALRVNEFKSMSQPIVLYCRSGSRSNLATAILKQAGISQVYNGGGLVDMKNLLN